MRTGQKRRGGCKMAAPEERDLTQEQTEKLLQFQVAASILGEANATAG